MYFRVIVSVLSMLICAGIVNAAPFAYIANNTDNTVSVLDTTSEKVTAVIPVGIVVDNVRYGGPYGVTVNRMGSRVYVSNQTPVPVSPPTEPQTYYYSVSVIDTLDNSVTSIPLSFQPGALAVNSAGTRLFVANPADDSVSIINTVNMSVVNTVALTTDCQPEGIAVDPVDASGYSKVFVSCFGRYVNSVALLTDQAVPGTYAKSLTEVPVPGGPKGIAVSADGKKVYVVSSKLPSKLTIIDALTLAAPAVGDSILVGDVPWGVAVDPSATNPLVAAKIYVTNSANDSVSVVQSLNNAISVVDTISVGSTPMGVAFVADGTKAVTANNNTGSAGDVSLILKSNNSVNTVSGNSGAGTNPPNMMIGNSPKSFGNFAGPEFVTITTGVNDYNCGKVDTSELITPNNGVYQVAKGKDVKFNITALPNCAISNVTLDSVALPGQPTSYTFVAPAQNYNIYGNFTRTAWILTVSMSGTGTGKVVTEYYDTVSRTYISGGGINCGTTCTAVNPTGRQIRILPVPDPGSELEAWTQACASVGGSGDCKLTLDTATATNKGAENGTFLVGVKFKNSGVSIRTNRGGTAKFYALLQDSYDAIYGGTAVNPIDLDTTREYSIQFTQNIPVTIVGGWTEFNTGGIGTLPAGSSSILNNGTSGVVVANGSLTIGSYLGNGAIIIK